MKQPDPQRRWTIKRKPLNRAWPEGDAVIGPDTDWVEVVPADDQLTPLEAEAVYGPTPSRIDLIQARGTARAKLRRIAGRED